MGAGCSSSGPYVERTSATLHLTFNRRIDTLEIRQPVFERHMEDEHRRMREKIEEVRASFMHGIENLTAKLEMHMQQEDNDRGMLLNCVTTTLVAIVLGMGGWTLMKVAGMWSA